MKITNYDDYKEFTAELARLGFTARATIIEERVRSATAEVKVSPKGSKLVRRRFLAKIDKSTGWIEFYAVAKRPMPFHGLDEALNLVEA